MLFLDLTTCVSVLNLQQCAYGIVAVVSHDGHANLVILPYQLIIRFKFTKFEYLRQLVLFVGYKSFGSRITQVFLQNR